MENNLLKSNNYDHIYNNDINDVFDYVYHFYIFIFSFDNFDYDYFVLHIVINYYVKNYFKKQDKYSSTSSLLSL